MLLSALSILGIILYASVMFPLRGLVIFQTEEPETLQFFLATHPTVKGHQNTDVGGKKCIQTETEDRLCTERRGWIFVCCFRVMSKLVLSPPPPPIKAFISSPSDPKPIIPVLPSPRPHIPGSSTNHA